MRHVGQCRPESSVDKTDRRLRNGLKLLRETTFPSVLLEAHSRRSASQKRMHTARFTKAHPGVLPPASRIAWPRSGPGTRERSLPGASRPPHTFVGSGCSQRRRPAVCGSLVPTWHATHKKGRLRLTLRSVGPLPLTSTQAPGGWGLCRLAGAEAPCRLSAEHGLLKD